MEDDQREAFVNHVRDQIEILKKDIVSYEELTKPVAPDNAIGRLTRMEAINSKSINEEALRKARLTLSKLERALRLVDNPAFGLCTACEEPIPFARLMIMPEADLCVQCAEHTGT